MTPETKAEINEKFGPFTIDLMDETDAKLFLMINDLNFKIRALEFRVKLLENAGGDSVG